MYVFAVTDGQALEHAKKPGERGLECRNRHTRGIEKENRDKERQKGSGMIRERQRGIWDGGKRNDEACAGMCRTLRAVLTCSPGFGRRWGGHFLGLFRGRRANRLRDYLNRGAGWHAAQKS